MKNYFKIILFTGKMGSGKTHCVNYIYKKLRERDEEVKIIKFAEPLYEFHNKFSPDKKNRLFLQSLGDLTKSFFGEEAFANYFIKKIKALIEETKNANKNIYVLLDDLRFIYEYKSLEKLQNEYKDIIDIIIYFLITPDEIRQKRIPDTFINTNHCSETEIDSLKNMPLVKEIINNSNNLSILEDKLNKIISSL